MLGIVTFFGCCASEYIHSKCIVNMVHSRKHSSAGIEENDLKKFETFQGIVQKYMEMETAQEYL